MAVDIMSTGIERVKRPVSCLDTIVARSFWRAAMLYSIHPILLVHGFENTHNSTSDGCHDRANCQDNETPSDR